MVVDWRVGLFSLTSVSNLFDGLLRGTITILGFCNCDLAYTEIFSMMFSAV